MSEQEQGPDQQQAPSRSTGMSRKNFLRGTAAAGVGGLVVGGGVGYAVGDSGSSSSSSGGSKSSIKIGSASPITGPYAGDGQQMVRGQQLAIEQINAAGGVGGHPLELVKVDTKDAVAGRHEDGDPESRLEERRRRLHAVLLVHVGRVPDPGAEEHPDVPRQHVARQRRLGRGAQGDEHLPGRPERALLRRGHHQRDPVAGHGRRLEADEQDDLHRHVERPLQPQHRQQLQVRRSRSSAGRSRASTSSRCRRPTGAACSSRSAMRSPT